MAERASPADSTQHDPANGWRPDSTSPHQQFPPASAADIHSSRASSFTTSRDQRFLDQRFTQLSTDTAQSRVSYANPNMLTHATGYRVTRVDVFRPPDVCIAAQGCVHTCADWRRPPTGSLAIWRGRRGAPVALRGAGLIAAPCRTIQYSDSDLPATNSPPGKREERSGSCTEAYSSLCRAP